jgi:catalase (peroxidase I)
MARDMGPVTRCGGKQIPAARVRDAAGMLAAEHHNLLWIAFSRAAALCQPLGSHPHQSTTNHHSICRQQHWQLPLPAAPAKLPDFKAVRADIVKVMNSDQPSIIAADTLADSSGGKPSYAALFSYLAWQCANTFRATDFAGGCNGARIRWDSVGRSRGLLQ